MPTLETPNSGTCANLPTTAPGGDASTREKAKDAQTYVVEDSDSEPKPDKEASNGAARTASPMIAHLHQMFSDRLDAMQSMGLRKLKLGHVPEPADHEGRMDGSVHVATHLSPLSLKAGAGQCSEADGPAGQVASEDESSQLFPVPWLLVRLPSRPRSQNGGLRALKIEVNELLRKGHLREFFSDKAKSHLSKETTCKPTEAAPVSPPRQDRVRPMPTLETPNSGTCANLPTTAPGGDASTREKAKDAQTYVVEDSDSEPKPDKEASNGAARTASPMIAHLHQMFSDRLDAMQSMVERFPGAYDGTTDPDDHVAQYRQRMLVVALPKGSREATMCKGFGSTLTGSALQCSRDLEKTSDSLYEILQHRAEPLQGHIARFNQEKVAIPECSIPTAVSAFKRGLLREGDLYKDLTKYQCKTMEDVLSRAWAQVKWEEDVASRAKDKQKPDPKTIRPDRTERDEKPSQRSARDSGN
ncbi:hypothetical protein F2Q69_00042227 [Brassica cretica]|uniref:Uncharacterized protein n=1 Tax=Brassica cretica TaxID=69181 RepID=A0A8S9N5I1_BRACR|nr:hypothetical protein F2Q69_00042227 [Brassica cretica]